MGEPPYARVYRVIADSTCQYWWREGDFLAPSLSLLVQGLGHRLKGLGPRLGQHWTGKNDSSFDLVFLTKIKKTFPLILSSYI